MGKDRAVSKVGLLLLGKDRAVRVEQGRAVTVGQG